MGAGADLPVHFGSTKRSSRQWPRISALACQGSARQDVASLSRRPSLALALLFARLCVETCLGCHQTSRQRRLTASHGLSGVDRVVSFFRASPAGRLLFLGLSAQTCLDRILCPRPEFVIFDVSLAIEHAHRPGRQRGLPEVPHLEILRRAVPSSVMRSIAPQHDHARRFLCNLSISHAYRR